MGEIITHIQPVYCYCRGERLKANLFIITPFDLLWDISGILQSIDDSLLEVKISPEDGGCLFVFRQPSKIIQEYKLAPMPASVAAAIACEFSSWSDSIAFYEGNRFVCSFSLDDTPPDTGDDIYLLSY